MMLIPRSIASRAEAKRVATPSSRNSPEVGCSMPARMLTSVDLPAPFSPMSARTRPRSRRTSTPASAVVPGNDLRDGARRRRPAVSCDHRARLPDVHATPADFEAPRHGVARHGADEVTSRPARASGSTWSEHVVDDAVVQRVRDPGELELVDEVGEADEVERVAKRRAPQHGTDLDGCGRRVRRPRASDRARPIHARLAVDVSDRRRALDEQAAPRRGAPALAGRLARPGLSMNVRSSIAERCAVGSTRDSQIDVT